ncbi:MAG TPA: hypothetical protein VNZ62_05920 [Capillimicrobium sp.]|nr:hypothetical protein [Capillimicrobium sp.]
MTAPRCARCARPVPPERTTYCTRRCWRAARRERWRAGRPDIAAEDARRRHELEERRVAFGRFLRATDSAKRLPVSEDEASQRQARALVAAGLAAYENRRGLLRDVGVPRDLRDAGAVWSKRIGLVRDARGRVVGAAGR